jgi:hypothetical protein
MAETRYTRDHEYIRVDGDTGTVGITDYAQQQLGDVVFVELPQVGKSVAKGGERRRGGEREGRERGLRSRRGRGRPRSTAISRARPAPSTTIPRGAAGSSR